MDTLSQDLIEIKAPKFMFWTFPSNFNGCLCSFAATMPSYSKRYDKWNYKFHGFNTFGLKGPKDIETAPRGSSQYKDVFLPV